MSLQSGVPTELGGVIGGNQKPSDCRPQITVEGQSALTRAFLERHQLVRLLTHLGLGRSPIADRIV